MLRKPANKKKGNCKTYILFITNFSNKFVFCYYLLYTSTNINKIFPFWNEMEKIQRKLGTKSPAVKINIQTQV